MGSYREVFELAAKVGSLEGYLYERPDASPRYFSNWLGNLESMWAALPKDVREDFRPQYGEVLSKVVEHMEKLLGSGDEHLLRAKRFLKEVSS